MVKIRGITVVVVVVEDMMVGGGGHIGDDDGDNCSDNSINHAADERKNKMRK